MIGGMIGRLPFAGTARWQAQVPAQARAVAPRRSWRLPPETPITSEEVGELLTSSPEVLTGEQGKRFFVSQSTRTCFCLLADGRLLVAKGQEHHPGVAELLERLDREKFALGAVHLVDMETVSSLYDRGSRRAVGEQDVERMVKDVLALIEEAADYNATDIRIELKGSHGEVRFSVNDNWIDNKQLPKDYTRLFLAAAYNMCAISDGTYKEGDFQSSRLTGEENPLPRNIESVRMQFGPVAGNGRFLVARLLPSRAGASARKTMESLGYDLEHIRMMRNIRATPFGVILMVGPTGSGKSTTLAVSMERRFEEMERKINIVTIEDPPEYEIYGALQLPIANVTREEERGQAFAMAFNSVLRMKPHVIMVGEVRDLPAAKLLIKASQSGHQCWTSLHTKNALTVPVRLKEMGIEPYLVKDSSIVVGAIFQRLVPKLCECALRYESRLVTPEVAQMVDVVCEGDFGQARLRNVAGCARCNKDKRSNPGYVGQTVVAEVLQPDDEILTACIEGRRQEAMERWLQDADAMTAFEHGLRKVYRGEVDPDDVYKRVYDRHDLARLRRDPARVAFVRQGRRSTLAGAVAAGFAPAIVTPARMRNLAEAADHVLDGRGVGDAVAVATLPRGMARDARPGDDGPAPEGSREAAQGRPPAPRPTRPVAMPLGARVPGRLTIPEGSQATGTLDGRARRP